jgi:hypothetical protein
MWNVEANYKNSLAAMPGYFHLSVFITVFLSYRQSACMLASLFPLLTFMNYATILLKVGSML